MSLVIASSAVFDNLRIDFRAPDEVAGAIAECAEPLAVHLVNAFSIYAFSQDVGLRNQLNSIHSLNLIDSRWLSIACSQLLGKKVDQVRGPDLMKNLMDESSKRGKSVFLLGGSETLLKLMVQRAHQDYPNLVIAGTLSPPFRALDSAEEQSIVQEIASAKPDLIFVGLGTPKQDHWVELIRRQIHVTSVALGAAFDFYGGTKSESPRVLSSLGLEWLFRLATEPKRLWRRYLFGNTHFFIAWLRAMRAK